MYTITQTFLERQGLSNAQNQGPDGKRVPVWFQSGPSLVPVWSQSGPSMEYGPSMKYGPSMVPRLPVQSPDPQSGTYNYNYKVRMRLREYIRSFPLTSKGSEVLSPPSSFSSSPSSPSSFPSGTGCRPEGEPRVRLTVGVGLLILAAAIANWSFSTRSILSLTSLEKRKPFITVIMKVKDERRKEGRMRGG